MTAKAGSGAGVLEVVLAGRSMEPTLLVGDVLTVEPLVAPARTGDVIVLSGMEGTHVCHRVVAVVRLGPSSFYVHRGDAPGAGFATVGAERVLGRVTEVRRRGDERPPRFFGEVSLETRIAAHLAFAKSALRSRRVRSALRSPRRTLRSGLLRLRAFARHFSG